MRSKGDNICPQNRDEQHFGTADVAQIRQKMLKYWHAADVAASRSKARSWLDVSILLFYFGDMEV